MPAVPGSSASDMLLRRQATALPSFRLRVIASPCIGRRSRLAVSTIRDLAVV